MRNLFITMLLLVGHCTLNYAQHLDSIAPKLRDSILTCIAKDVVQKYGPDYFRDYKKPDISRELFVTRVPSMMANMNRPFYAVIFYYDPEIEKDMLAWAFMYKIYVWADNWQPFTAGFGNGLGIKVSDFDGERISNLNRKKFGVPTTKPNNYDYKLESVVPMTFQPLTDKKQAENLRQYLIKEKKEQKELQEKM